MPGRKPPPMLRCEFTYDGEELSEIMLRCFRSFLYRQMQVNSGILQQRQENKQTDGL